MALRDRAFSIARKFGFAKPPVDVFTHRVDASEAARFDVESASPLRRRFLSHQGRQIYKWVHSLDIYDDWCARFVETDVRLLEIGVFQGGSLELWRSHFGQRATIFGIDIDPACAARCDAPNQVRIGSQSDPAFLRATVAEMGGVDLVIDDGSHIGRDQRASFAALWPLLNDGGLYVIEDLLTSYLPGPYAGGYGRRGTGIDLVKALADAVQQPFHLRGGLGGNGLWSLHLYPNMAVIEKRAARPLAHIKTGAPA